MLTLRSRPHQISSGSMPAAPGNKPGLRSRIQKPRRRHSGPSGRMRRTVSSVFCSCWQLQSGWKRLFWGQQRHLGGFQMVSTGVGKPTGRLAGGHASATGTRGASVGATPSALSAHCRQPAIAQGMTWSHRVSQQGWLRDAVARAGATTCQAARNRAIRNSQRRVANGIDMSSHQQRPTRSRSMRKEISLIRPICIAAEENCPAAQEQTPSARTPAS